MYEISVIKFYVRPVTMKSKVFPAFSSIRIEYREKLRISPHSVRMRENAGKTQTRITPNTDTFYEVNKSAVGRYLLKVNDENIWTLCEIWSNLTIQKDITDVILVSFLLTLNRFYI